MILLDTSVLIDYFRTSDRRLLALMQQHAAAICGVTRAEVLHGALGAQHRQRLLTTLNTFGQVLIPDALWDSIGDNLAVLRSRGVTVPFADVVIATVALAADVELWARDGHFADVQRIIPALRLFQEPP